VSLLGNKLKELRGDRSLRDVEREIGMDRSDLSKYERGRFVPSSERLQKLADYYDHPYRELRKLYFIDLFTEPEDHELILEWAAEELAKRNQL
jgi:transcriptional regulator with XRE-family HTH domain